MLETLHTCFSGPILPASLLLLVVSAYWLLVILGAVELGWLDLNVDLDVDGSPDAPLLPSAGMIVLKFLNIGPRPVMLWLSIFTLVLWITSVVWYDASYGESTGVALQVFLRNCVVALVAAKLVTQPMIRFVDQSRQHTARDLIGQVCTITTRDVTEGSGQARLNHHGAPLLLNVRTRAGQLAKGEQARIVDFDPTTLVYFVERDIPDPEEVHA